MRRKCLLDIFYKNNSCYFLVCKCYQLWLLLSLFNYSLLPIPICSLSVLSVGVLYWSSEKVLSLLINLLLENVTRLKASYVFEGLPENHIFTKQSLGCSIIVELPHYNPMVFHSIFTTIETDQLFLTDTNLFSHLHCKIEHLYYYLTSLQTPQQDSLLNCYRTCAAS